jgi:hypothetical protein
MRTLYTLALAGLIAGLCGPTFAQTPGPGGPNCLFPLACPGPVPPKPEPLYGPPEDAATVQPAEDQPRPKHHVRKRVAKHKA